jgi:hypothetical protein
MIEENPTSILEVTKKKKKNSTQSQSKVTLLTVKL